MEITKHISNIQDMVIFASVIESGSFTNAAKQLGLSPSSISRSISRLEANLQCRLINRTTRKQQLTQMGEEVFHQCRQLVDHSNAVYQLSSQHEETTQGVVHIAAPRALGAELIHPALQRFMYLNPQVKVKFSLTDQAIDLVESNIDLVIRFSNEPAVGLIGRRLLSSRSCLVASPGYLASTPAIDSPKDLLKHQCLPVNEDAHDLNWRFKRGNQRANIAVPYQYAVNHAGIRQQLALDGHGIAILPSFAAKTALDNGQLEEVLSEWRVSAKYAGDVWLLQSAHKYHNSATKALYQYLGDYFLNQSH